MKATGIVRRIDDLGRIVIPKELRTMFHIEDMDPLEIYVQDDAIVLVPYRPGCIFCHEVKEQMSTLMGQLVCHDCARQVGELAPVVFVATDKSR